METTISLKKKIIFNSEIKVTGATEETLDKLEDYTGGVGIFGTYKDIEDILIKIKSLGMGILDVNENDYQGTEYEYMEDGPAESDNSEPMEG